MLPLVLWSMQGSGDTPASAAATPSRTPGRDTPSPGASYAGTPTGTQGALRGRLHNLASGLCVDVVGEKAVEGAETELAACSASASQQWTYETDGLLRSAAAPRPVPGLPPRLLGPSVPSARPPAGPPATSTTTSRSRAPWCLAGTRSWPSRAAATDGSGALVLKTRAPGTAQRWSVDTAHADLRMENVNWGGDSTPVPPSRRASRGTPSGPATRTPSATPRGPVPRPRRRRRRIRSRALADRHPPTRARRTRSTAAGAADATGGGGRRHH
ncbi:hypothetical protein GCM10017687_37140 [Streptomyces echinatus]|uniref:ricin-type beta-trefoil lectin domain protein n=1 Tax=Streptomyces echinatus TaxID=67293 RepID=UPI0033778D96